MGGDRQPFENARPESGRGGVPLSVLVRALTEDVPGPPPDPWLAWFGPPGQRTGLFPISGSRPPGAGILSPPSSVLPDGRSGGERRRPESQPQDRADHHGAPTDQRRALHLQHPGGEFRSGRGPVSDEVTPPRGVAAVGTSASRRERWQGIPAAAGRQFRFAPLASEARPLYRPAPMTPFPLVGSWRAFACR